MIEQEEEDYTEDYYRAYFGQNADYYMRKLEQYQNGRKFMFNLGAFFFSMLWMLYRKLYIPALIYLGIVTLQGFLLQYLAKNNQITEQTTLYIDRGMAVIWSIIIGFIGNYLYLKQAQRKVSKAKRSDMGAQEAVNQLSLVGGITYLPHIILAVMALLVMLQS